jgi:hypothetical protein
MKICIKCGENKKTSEFYNDGKHIHTKCKVCANLYQRAYELKNKEKRAKYTKVYRKLNAERLAEYNASWIKKNYSRHCAMVNKRRAALMGATPKWAIQFFINEAYDLARMRTRSFGFPWHVDHTVPLKSKIVCGLHVENNLRVIPGVENLSKGNRSWPDMPENNS